MLKEKNDNLLIFHDAELLQTSNNCVICCEIHDKDITENHYFMPENKYYMKGIPNQESEIIWHTANGHFWMEGKISHPSKITITLVNQK